MIKLRFLCLCLSVLICSCSYNSQDDDSPDITPPREGDSVSRTWNEHLLNAIRDDFARPTVHARNLFHVSAAMYDAWAAYSGTASTYLLGKQLGGFACGLNAFTSPADF